MPTPLTDADKVLRNDTGKDIVTQLTSIASSIATPASLVGLSDTAITTPTDGQELTYNSSLSKWNNKTTRVELTQQQYDLLVANNEDLPDVDYYITDAGGAEVVSSAPNISDVYNPNTTYNTGDLCIYNNVLYKCKTNSVTGAWDGTKWDRTTVQSLIGSLSTLTTTDKSSIVGAVNELDSDKVNTSDIDTTLNTTSPNPIANSAVATAINGIGFKKASISSGNKTLTDLQAFCKTGEKGLLWAVPYVTTPSTGWAFVIFANKIVSDSHAEIYIFFNDKITSSYTSNLTATTPTWSTKSGTLS